MGFAALYPSYTLGRNGALRAPGRAGQCAEITLVPIRGQGSSHRAANGVERFQASGVPWTRRQPLQEVGMRFLGRRGSIASVVVGLTCVVATLAWAGGSGFGDDDDAGEDEGPPYFGFVKDANGSTLPDSKVTVSVKDRGGV